MTLRSIDVDWDIHKLIESERQGFDEPPHIALRRLLGLPDDSSPSDYKKMPDVDAPALEFKGGLPWTEGGVIVPHGSLARMEYDRGNQVYEGGFYNGKLVVRDRSFDTLSAAASALATTKEGHKTSLNGWNYWYVKFPSESEWRSLHSIRNGPNLR